LQLIVFILKRDIEVKKQAVPYLYFSAKDARGPEAKAANEALGRYRDRQVKEGFLPLGLYSFPNISDGLVRTSVRQFSHFLAMYLNDGSYKGKRILRKTTVDTMLSNDHFGRGLCWYKEGNEFWQHGGGDPGIVTLIAFDRTKKAGLIVFISGTSNEAYDGLHKILIRLFAGARRSN
jgi:hypothetical protein